MLDLWFQCPKSGSGIPSGIRTDDASIRRVAQLPVTVFCPLCKENHRMRVCDGQLIDVRPRVLTDDKRRTKSRSKAVRKLLAGTEINQPEAALEAKAHR